MILCIDTAIDSCSVAFSWEGNTIDSIINPEARKASEVLHRLIRQLVEKNNLSLNDLKAVAINGGPGSYTGLRIATSTAKGLCYALDIPLIHLDGLQLMTSAIVNRYNLKDFDHYIPLIDARRNEVFTAILNSNLTFITEGHPLVIDEASWQDLEHECVVFFGNGAEKTSHILGINTVPKRKGHTFISDFTLQISDFNHLVWDKWINQDFANLFTYKPNYLKKFYSTAKKLK